MCPSRKGDNQSIKANDKEWTHFADRRKPDAHPASAIPTNFTEGGSMARTLSIWVYTVMPPAKHNRKRSSVLRPKPAYPIYIRTYIHTYIHTYTHAHTHIHTHT